MNQYRTSFKNNASADSIRETAFSFQKSRVLLTAHELGIFTALGASHKYAKEVAGLLKTDERATERLLNALCVFGLIKKVKGKFLNTPLSLRYLVKGKPGYLAGLTHYIRLWDTWSTLTEAVRKGTTVTGRTPAKHYETWLRGFISAMHERGFKQAQAAVKLIDLSRVKNVLDVGGGSGIFSLAIVRAKKRIKATVFDLPDVIPLTRDYIRKEKLQDRIKTVCGDYNIDDLGKGFDLVLLSAIVHSNSYKQNLKLIQKCSRALNPQGQVAVSDFIMDEDRLKPAFGAVFALNMLVNTVAGDTYTESEVRAWMENAGLSRITRKDTPFDASLIIGRKI